MNEELDLVSSSGGNMPVSTPKVEEDQKFKVHYITLETLYNRFKASLGYTRLCLKKIKNLHLKGTDTHIQPFSGQNHNLSK